MVGVLLVAGMEAQGMTAERVRCSAWLGVAGFLVLTLVVGIGLGCGYVVIWARYEPDFTRRKAFWVGLLLLCPMPLLLCSALGATMGKSPSETSYSSGSTTPRESSGRERSETPDVPSPARLEARDGTAPMREAAAQGGAADSRK